MPFLDILYDYLVHGATAVEEGTTVHFPIILRIVIPDRIGTAVWHLPGGALQTADFIIPGYTITMEIGEYTLRPV